MPPTKYVYFVLELVSSTYTMKILPVGKSRRIFIEGEKIGRELWGDFNEKSEYVARLRTRMVTTHVTKNNPDNNHGRGRAAVRFA